jgi:hypothetical protein
MGPVKVVLGADNSLGMALRMGFDRALAPKEAIYMPRRRRFCNSSGISTRMTSEMLKEKQAR